MNINALSKYKVKYKSEMCYNMPSYEELNNWKTETSRWTRNVDGYKLIEWLSFDLKDKRVLEFDIENNKIHIGYFEPTTGETSDFWYEIIKEIK